MRVRCHINIVEMTKCEHCGMYYPEWDICNCRLVEEQLPCENCDEDTCEGNCSINLYV